MNPYGIIEKYYHKNSKLYKILMPYSERVDNGTNAPARFSTCGSWDKLII